MKIKRLKTIENNNANHVKVISSSGNLYRKEVNKMFKKLLITGAAAGLLLVSAAGAFADQGSSITITGHGTVYNTVNTSANTGYNGITGGSVKNSGITTGAANSGANLMNQVNFNQFSCGCVLGSGEDNSLTLKIDGTATVGNTVNTSSNTGYNVLSAMGGYSHEHEHTSNSSGVSGSWITTGAAGASSVVSNVVNTNVFGTTTP
jgi:hypothetical protein